MYPVKRKRIPQEKYVNNAGVELTLLFIGIYVLLNERIVKLYILYSERTNVLCHMKSRLIDSSLLHCRHVVLNKGRISSKQYRKFQHI